MQTQPSSCLTSEQYNDICDYCLYKNIRSPLRLHLVVGIVEVVQEFFHLLLFIRCYSSHCSKQREFVLQFTGRLRRQLHFWLRSFSLLFIVQQIEHIPYLCQIFLKKMIMCLSCLCQRDKGIHQLSFPEEKSFPAIETLYFRPILLQTLEDLLPLFPISIQHKILIDEMRDGKVQKQLFS